jgi:hypothetical protein
MVHWAGWLAPIEHSKVKTLEEQIPGNMMLTHDADNP